jgi:uncharacterized membrane protein
MQPGASALARRPRLAAGGVALLVVASVPVALYAFGFPFVHTLGAPGIRARLGDMPVFAYAHFLGGGLALLIGAAQFNAQFRAARPALHRGIGRTYLVAVLFAGTGGLAMATRSQGGLPAHTGFALLAVLWLATALVAWRAIRAGDVARHRLWMARNFALTFAAVTLRAELGLLLLAGVPFAEAYATVAWLCWVPNLLVAGFLVPRPAAAGRDAPAHAG